MNVLNHKPKSEQYLTFQLKNQTFGFSIVNVQEINRMMEITPVPKTAKGIIGVINLRGKVIPVVDLSLQLNMEFSVISKNTCIIVTECESGRIGVVVDFVNSVVEINENQIEVIPTVNQAKSGNYVVGLAKVENQVIVLLDIIKVLSKESLAEPITTPLISKEEGDFTWEKAQ